MNEEAKILAYAQRMGTAANHAELVAQTAAGDIYALSLEDDNGFPLPTGLPRFVISKGGNYKLVDGEAGLKLSRSLSLEE